MQKLKRFLASACALVVCLGMAACGDTEDADNGDTASKAEKQENTAIEMTDDQKAKVGDLASKVPDVELANKTVKFLGHYDINPSEGQVVSPGLQLFRDKYQGEIEWVETSWDNRYSDLSKLVLSGDAPDMFSPMDMDAFPKCAINNLFDPVDDYIDLDSDLWSDTAVVNDMFVYKGKHYIAATRSAPNIVCIYNTRVIQENGLEDPAELYKNGEWTLSKFEEMCKAFTDAENEKFALDGWYYEQGLLTVYGKPLIGMENGAVVNNMTSEELKKAEDFAYQLHQESANLARPSHGGLPRHAEDDPNAETQGYGVADGLTLFFPCGLWGIENTPDSVKAIGDVEAGEIMFVPMPKPDDGEHYMLSRVEGYALCHNAPNPEGFAAFMNCQKAAIESDAAITQEQLKNDYKWNDDMIAMRDEAYRLAQEKPVFEFAGGISNDLYDLYDKTIERYCMGNVETTAKTWDEVVAEYKDEVDYKVKQASEGLV